MARFLGIQTRFTRISGPSLYQLRYQPETANRTCNINAPSTMAEDIRTRTCGQDHLHCRDTPLDYFPNSLFLPYMIPQLPIPKLRDILPFHMLLFYCSMHKEQLGHLWTRWRNRHLLSVTNSHSIRIEQVKKDVGLYTVFYTINLHINFTRTTPCLWSFTFATF